MSKSEPEAHTYPSYSKILHSDNLFRQHCSIGIPEGVMRKEWVHFLSRRHLTIIVGEAGGAGGSKGVSNSITRPPYTLDNII